MTSAKTIAVCRALLPNNALVAITLSVALLPSCHAPPADELSLQSHEPATAADGGSTCVTGFLLTNRALGDAFVLQAYQKTVREMLLPLVPVDVARPTTVLWLFEPAATENSTYRIRNVAFADLLLSNVPAIGLMLAAPDDADDPEWRIERKALASSELAVDTFVLRPTNALGFGLATTFAPPYMAQLVPGDKESGHYWVPRSRTYCGGMTEGL